LANLDVKRKGELRELLRNISKKGKTIIHVTHDYMEAATLSNKVTIIENGKLQQTGAPEQVFRHPASEFVARFSGVRNIFPCIPSAESDESGLQKVLVEGLGELFFIGEYVSRDGYVMIDQHGIILSGQALETSALNSYKGVVTEAYQAGHGMEIIVHAGVDFVVLISHASYDALKIKPGKEIWLHFKASSARFISN
jgi:molybdate transport system ATP-binding protein